MQAAHLHTDPQASQVDARSICSGKLHVVDFRVVRLVFSPALSFVPGVNFVKLPLVPDIGNRCGCWGIINDDIFFQEVISFREVISITKGRTAKLFPNAILIETDKKKVKEMSAVIRGQAGLKGHGHNVFRILS